MVVWVWTPTLCLGIFQRVYSRFMHQHTIMSVGNGEEILVALIRDLARDNFLCSLAALAS